MKFALGFLTACFLIIVGAFVFAPDYAHEIIDGVHGNPAAKPPVLEKDNEDTNGTIDDPAITPRSAGISVPAKSPIDDSVTTTEKQVLGWLRTHNYEVEKLEERGLYLISSREQKRTFSEPSGVVITGSGTVATLHNQSIIKQGSKTVKGQKHVADIREDGISITASVTQEPDENGSWWIETTRSFFWDSDQDSIDYVLSQAAALRSVGIVVTDGRSVYIR